MEKEIRATALVIFQDKILVIHRHRNGEEYFLLPGGSVEENETTEKAVTRELFEETSITGELGKKIYSCIDKYNKEHQVFLVEYKFGEPKLQPDSVEVARTLKDSTNTYDPKWIKKSIIKDLVFRPVGMKEFLLSYFDIMRI